MKMVETREYGRKKGVMIEDSPESSFGKRDIGTMRAVAEKLSGGKYRIKSPVYRASDDRTMAKEGVEVKGARIKRMQEEIAEALNRGRSSPYYTNPV